MDLLVLPPQPPFRLGLPDFTNENLQIFYGIALVQAQILNTQATKFKVMSTAHKTFASIALRVLSNPSVNNFIIMANIPSLD